jgi:hypothetical protein
MIPLIGILGLVAASRAKVSSGGASSPGGMAPAACTQRGEARPAQDRAALFAAVPGACFIRNVIPFFGPVIAGCYFRRWLP